MNDYLISVLLGVVEGLTEFLPVSSTAHLRICQDLLRLRLDDPFWKMYAVVIQLGAVLCLPVYFGPRLARFVRSFPKGEFADKTIFTHPLTLVMIAFVCTAVPAFVLKKVISRNLENLHVIGGALLIGGAVMWAVDALFTSPKTEAVERMTIPQAAWIGLVQVLSAVFPGTSRSMATIAAGQVVGLTRAAALEFSFFVSIPVMFAACLFDLRKALKPGMDDANLAPLHMSGHDWVVLAIGFVVSFLVALGVVAWFMGWVRKRGFVPFAIYRILLGLWVLLWLAPRAVGQ